MLTRLFVNMVYLIPLQVNQFKKQHPDAEVLIADGAKARRVSSNDTAQYAMGWATARRSALILTAQELVCGDWVIPIASIQEAVLVQIAGGSLLKISTTDGTHYQFGLQRNPDWEKQTVLPLKIEQGILSFSKTSLIVRLILLIWLAILMGQYYSQYGLHPSLILFLILFIWTSIPLLRLLRYRLEHKA